ILAIDRLHIHQFDRIGIVGKNGAGKSTLLKVIMGEVVPAEGTIISHVSPAYFEQIEPPTTEEVDGEMLSRLGVSDVYEHASGGEETRLKLAQLFSQYNEALLMDEPTRHLDEEGISFLTESLQYYYGALVLVSHDRQVLDDVVTKIWEVHDGKITVYNGNYTAYEAAKKEEKETHIEAHESYMKEKARLQKAAAEKMQKANKLLQSNAARQKKAEGKPRIE